MLAHPGHHGMQHRAKRSYWSSFSPRWGLFILIWTLAVYQGGCVRPLVVPLETEWLTATEQPHRILLIYLPGNGDAADAFKRNGLISLLHDRNIFIDVLGVNAQLGYYLNGSIIERLKQDVIDPAKRKGYDRIWLVGNSLGAYGALIYTTRYPADVSGVVLLGVYAGERAMIREIEHAGSLHSWVPGIIEQKDWDRQLWSWLKNYEGRASEYPPLYLGYGHWDRFVYAQDLVATVLPADRVVALAGGHDWSTWKKAWGLLLERIAPQLK
jgi:pimeloyl-ACP methyl ester carboxylesterase